MVTTDDCIFYICKCGEEKIKRGKGINKDIKMHVHKWKLQAKKVAGYDKYYICICCAERLVRKTDKNVL
jgi:hypothetical protein